jgi:GNAT acetyltransferase-like protein
LDTEGLQLRRATPDDGPAIRQLLSTVYEHNAKADPEVMRWQYWDNPFGQAVSWIWTDGGNVVSHSARLPVEALVGGKKVRCGIGVDAATSPDYRRRGLYERLRSALHEDCCRQEIVATLLLLGPQSTVPRIEVRAGIPLLMFVLPLDADWISDQLRIPRIAARTASRLFRPPKTRGGREVESPPDGLDELWSELSGAFPSSIIKGSAWWRWRYEQHPRVRHRFFEVRDGRLVGAAVTLDRPTAHGRVVYILDLLASSADTARALVRSALDSADGASALALLAPGGSPPAQWARAAGLRKVPRRLASSTHTLGVWDTCTDAPSASAPWSFTWGDADYL